LTPGQVEHGVPVALARHLGDAGKSALVELRLSRDNK
jgi:hypothetical protein